MSTARAKINAIREESTVETKYSTELTQPLRLIARNMVCVIRRIPHAQAGEINPYTAQGRVIAAQFGGGEIRIENACGEIVFHAYGGRVLFPEDEIEFWRRLGA